MNSFRLWIVGLLCLFAAQLWAADGVIVGDKEWLQPADFTGYTYDQVSAVCPAGACSGTLPGSSFDLSGYRWAAIDEVSALFNSYGASPPFTAPFQERSHPTLYDAFAVDFAITTSSCYGDCPIGYSWVVGMVQDPAPTGDLPYTPVFLYFDDEGMPEKYFFTGNWDNLGDPFGIEDIGVWLYRPLEDGTPNPDCTTTIVKLEEPIHGEVHSGLGQLRGWAIDNGGISRVAIYIDGIWKYDLPYGHRRLGVGNAYPDINGSSEPGFSRPFNYSNLEFGEHTIVVRAFNIADQWCEVSATFNVITFDELFIERNETVDTSQAAIDAKGNEIYLEDVLIGDRLYNLTLRWRTEEQGFEIVEIQ